MRIYAYTHTREEGKRPNPKKKKNTEIQGKQTPYSKTQVRLDRGKYRNTERQKAEYRGKRKSLKKEDKYKTAVLRPSNAYTLLNTPVKG